VKQLIGKLLERVGLKARPLPDRAPEGHKRSTHWPAVRRAWLAQHPTCAACGGTKSLQVHHKVPFHLDPSKELSPTNFITLCEAPGLECHLHVGHKKIGGGYDWKCFNPFVESDAAKMLAEKEKKAHG
jgi:hypothetical protein